MILFIPKPERKGFRPVSLSSNISKLFERLIHRRLEYIAESKNWFPPFQYGSCKARSSSDCAAVAYTDILLSFEENESVLAVSLDIKGAYNCVRHDQLIHQIQSLNTPSRILNFVNFMTASRNLYFSANDTDPKKSHVGVPQGAVLSPFLYNVYTNQIMQQLNSNTKATLYFDDIFLYTSNKNINAGIMEWNASIVRISTWLSELGLNISTPKFNFCNFSKSKIDTTMLSIQINDHRRMHVFNPYLFPTHRSR